MLLESFRQLADADQEAGVYRPGKAQQDLKCHTVWYECAAFSESSHFFVSAARLFQVVFLTTSLVVPLLLAGV